MPGANARWKKKEFSNFIKYSSKTASNTQWNLENTT
jgi:hypothetical protein